MENILKEKEKSKIMNKNNNNNINKDESRLCNEPKKIY